MVMLRRLSLAALCILILPWLFSQPTDFKKSSEPLAFSGIAMAGHTNPGGEYCTCGCPACICDPGERPTICDGAAPAQLADDETGKADLDSELTAGAMIFALALLAWRMLR